MCIQNKVAEPLYAREVPEVDAQSGRLQLGYKH